MINLLIDEKSRAYEAGELIRAFESGLSEEELIRCQKYNIALSSKTCTGKLVVQGILREEVMILFTLQEEVQDEMDHIVYKRCLYRLLQLCFKKTLPWGVLTGIRPVKIVHSMLEKGFATREIIQILQDKYLISDQKANLMVEIAEVQRPFLKSRYKDGMSLYFSIPFCPTRCHYCSFFSSEIKRYGHLREAYLDALENEIAKCSPWIAKQEKTIQSVYIGGGTPGTLSSAQIERLYHIIEKYFDCSAVEEWTFESGRPDAITQEQLQTLKKLGNDRISINPQSMLNATLKHIGRDHSAEDVEAAFILARNHGMNNINMDFILGLEGETAKDVHASLSRIITLNPDALTIHVLSLKKGSLLKEEGISILNKQRDIQRQIQVSSAIARSLEMQPYYLYRQKNMIGNVENIGYSKKNKICLYNIFMMEDVHPVVAFGSGASSKFFFQDNRIERCINAKNLEEYLKRSDEMALRKKEYLLL